MENKMDQLLSELRHKHNIAGMAIAITDRERILYAKGFGVDSLERPTIPTSPESMYRIASITKVITGITILQLVQQGILDLDLPLKEYVPWLCFRREKLLRK